MTKLSINYLLAAEEQDPFRCSLTVDELARAEMASFRLRCGLVAKFLEGQGHKIRICSPSSDGGFFDHLIVQKPPLSTATHHGWLQFAHEWKQRGTSIWLDVSDNPWTGGPRIDFVKRISPICSGFIANSDLIANALNESFQLVSFVLPDPVEFKAQEVRSTSNSSERLLWFGHPSNLPFLVPWLKEIGENPKIKELVLLSNVETSTRYLESVLPYKLANLPFRLSIHPWNPGNMLAVSRSVDVCIVPAGHRNPEKQGASDNRLVTSIMLGLPTIATPLDSYKRWENGCILSESVNDGLNRLRVEREVIVRNLPDVQREIQTSRSIEAISLQLVDILQTNGKKPLKKRPEIQKEHSGETSAQLDLQRLFKAAITAHKKGDLETAKSNYLDVLSVDPNHLDALHNLGVLFLDNNQVAESQPHLNKSVRLAPKNTVYLNSLATANERLGNFDAAKMLFEQALAANPDDHLTLLNFSALLIRIGLADQALPKLNHLLTLNSRNRNAFINRAEAYLRLNLPLQAKADLEAALKIDPNDAITKFTLSTTLLKIGDYRHGWSLYENRWQLGQAKVRRFDAPQWDGIASLKGKRVLIYAEQGFGDVIQFCRYAKLLGQSSGARVVLETPLELLRLMERLDGVDAVIEFNQLPGFVDFVIPMMSLPKYLQPDSTDIYHSQPYLSVGDNHKDKWKRKLEGKQRKKGPMVGICWAGSQRKHHRTSSEIDKRRSFTINELIRYIDLENSTIVNLQKDIKSREWEKTRELFTQLSVVDFSSELSDFYETAGLVSQLDHVVTVDTSIAHLTGALGIPTTVIHRKDSCWRWGYQDFRPSWYAKMEHRKNEG